MSFKSNPELKEALEQLAKDRNAKQASISEAKITDSAKSFINSEDQQSVREAFARVDLLLGEDNSADISVVADDHELGQVGYADIDGIDLKERSVLEVKHSESFMASMYIFRKQKILANLDQSLIDMLEIRNENKDKILPQVNDMIKKIEAKREKVEELIATRAMQSSEAYTMYHAMQLVDFQKQMNGGKIVETESVHREVLRVQESMLEGNPILLYGPPGTGKTEVAKHAADKIKKEKNKKLEKSGKNLNDNPAFYIVSGSKDFHYSELAGNGGVRSKGLTAENIKQIEIQADEAVKIYIESYKRRNSRSKPLEADVLAYRRDKVDMLSKMYSQGMETYFNYGPLYEAMENGVPLIVDEANLIAPGVIGKLNEYMTRRPGDQIRTQENGGREITIQKGFCVVYTGNIGAQFQDRFKIESSQRDRTGLIIKYDYVPNCTDPNAKREEIVAGDTKTNAGKSELCHIMLAYFMDKKARMQLPRGDEDQLWAFAKAARYAQEVYAGSKDAEIKIPSGSGSQSATTASSAIREYQFSMRSIFNILDEYRKDSSLPLGYHIAQKFIIEQLMGDKNATLVYLEIFKKFGLVDGDLAKMPTTADANQREKIKQNAKRKIINTKDYRAVEEGKGLSGELELVTFSSRDTVTLAFGRDTNFETDKSSEKYQERYASLATPEEQYRLELENIRQDQAKLEQQLEETKKENQNDVETGLQNLQDNNNRLENIKADLKKAKRLLLKNPNKAQITNIEVIMLAAQNLIDKVKKETQDKDFDFLDQERVEGILEKIKDKIEKQEELIKNLSPNAVSHPRTRTINLSLLQPFKDSIILEGNTNPGVDLAIRPAADTLAGIYEWDNFKNWVRPDILPTPKQIKENLSVHKTKEKLTTLRIAVAMDYGTVDTSGLFTPNPSNPPFTKQEAINILSLSMQNQKDIKDKNTNTPVSKEPLMTDANYNIFIVYDYKDEADEKAGKKSCFFVTARWVSGRRKWVLLASGGADEWDADVPVFSRN